MKQHEKKQIDVCWQSGISEIVREKYESSEDDEASYDTADDPAHRRRALLSAAGCQRRVMCVGQDTYEAVEDTTLAVGNDVEVNTPVLVRTSITVDVLPSEAMVETAVLNVDRLVNVVVTGAVCGALSAAD